MNTKTETMITKTSQILNVHSGAIHIENKVKLLSRQAWFYMLYKAFPYLQTQTTFKIYLTDLKKAINYQSKNNKYLKEALKELAKTFVEWNIFEKDKGEVWEINSLLAGCRIEKGTGICHYAFSPFLQRKLANPEMYVKLNLLISQRFKSKYSLAIYCLALDYLNVKNNYSEKKLTLEELRAYLGLKSNEYKLVGHIQERILQRAEQEINNDSDIEIKIIPIISTGKKIGAFKFCMSIKQEYLQFYLPQHKKALPEPQQTNITDLERIENIYQNKIEVEISVVKNEQLKEFLSKHSISLSAPSLRERLQAIKEKLGEEKFEDYLFHIANYVKREQKGGMIKSIAGLYITLIKDDEQLENYQYSAKQVEKKKKEQEEKINKIYEEKLKSVYNNQLCSHFREYLEENYQQHESLFIEVINKNINPFMKQYAIDKKNNGKIDKNLLKNNMFMVLIFEKSELFGYSPIKYEIWKETFIEDEKNKEHLIKLQQEAIREENTR